MKARLAERSRTAPHSVAAPRSSFGIFYHIFFTQWLLSIFPSASVVPPPDCDILPGRFSLKVPPVFSKIAEFW